MLWTVGDYNNEPVQSRCTAEPFLAVSDAETAPVSVAPAESKPWTAVAGSKPRLQLQVTRRGDFTETLKLKATGLAPLDALKEVEVDAKTNAVIVEIDLAQIKLEPGTHTLHFTGQTKGKYRNNPEAADKAKEKLKGLEQETTTAAAEAKQAAETLESARKTGNTDLAALEASSSAAADKAKEAEIRKTAAAEEAKRADERAKPREVLYTVYSRPIQLVIQPPETK